MANQNTTIIFIPGAFHTPDGYDAVISRVQKAGYDTLKVRLPSVLEDGNIPHSDIVQDIAEIKKHVTVKVDAGKEIVIVMHSYAGIPGTEAAEGLDQASLATQGHTDGRGVIHLVYLAALLLRAGENAAGILTGPLDWVDIREDTSVVPTRPADTFYNDFESQAEIDSWIANLKPSSFMTMLSTATHETWKKVPATYLSCKKDNTIPIDAQKGMITRAIQGGAIDLREVEWDCGHTPFGVKPLEVSELILNATGKSSKTQEKKTSTQVEVTTTEVVL